jgi:hypothetical protein
MAKVKVSPFWCEPELKEWLVSYAKDRDVSQGKVLEAALRELQASAMSGVPDLGEDGKPAAVTPLVRPAANVHRLGPSRGPVRIESPEDARSWAWERQKRLNRGKGL